MPKNEMSTASRGTALAGEVCSPKAHRGQGRVRRRAGGRNGQQYGTSGPGRPLVDRDIRTVILDVAEQMFAAKGFVSTATRDIAREADVRPSMISYYFVSSRRFRSRLQAARPGPWPNCGCTTWTNCCAALVASQPWTKSCAPTSRRSSSSSAADQGTRLRAAAIAPAQRARDLAFKLRRGGLRPLDEAVHRATRKPAAGHRSRRRELAHGVPGGHVSVHARGVDRLDDLSDGRFQSGNEEELVARMANFLTHGFGAPSTPQTWRCVPGVVRPASVPSAKDGAA